MDWTGHSAVRQDSGRWAELDRLRAFGPSVLEDDDGTLRMWYSGHDGSTARILHAVRAEGPEWVRGGVCVDPGFGGESDDYGVESPNVVRTPGGLLMAYAGSDGAETQLHAATSDDGRHWNAHGTFLQRGEPDSVGATHPCLVVTAERWWLFYTGYDGSENGRRASILAAVSPTGASWDRVGPVLEPEPGELAVSEPCVVITRRHFSMLYVSHDGHGSTIELATSDDGISWQRRGTSLRGDGGRYARNASVRSPCLLQRRDGGLTLFYAASSASDVEDGYRLWSAEPSERSR